MTRAKKLLYLSYAQSRKLFGQDTDRTPSRFLDEIPEKYINFNLSGLNSSPNKDHSDDIALSYIKKIKDIVSQ